MLGNNAVGNIAIGNIAAGNANGTDFAQIMGL